MSCTVQSGGNPDRVGKSHSASAALRIRQLFAETIRKKKQNKIARQRTKETVVRESNEKRLEERHDRSKDNRRRKPKKFLCSQSSSQKLSQNSIEDLKNDFKNIIRDKVELSAAYPAKIDY